MEEADLILRKAKREAERIVNMAKKEAEELGKVSLEKQITFHEYSKKLARKGFRIRHECDDWFLEDTDESIKKEKEALKVNLAKQRKLGKRGSYGFVEWKTVRWGTLHKCSECDNGVAYLILKSKMADMGRNYMETILENAKYNYLKWGLQKSLDYLMELKACVEDQMSILSQNPTITKEYLDLKIEEVKLRYNIDYRKQKAKEEMAVQKAAEREEMKAQKEFERELKKAQKDEEEARKALEKAQIEAAKEKENSERFAKLQQQIEKLQNALKEAEERGQRIMSMAQQTRRGWVYVISNIGSFGEGVYKIGLTRRLDPMERVYELGDASVPFPFDVHAFIFSEDAPALETALHQAFEKNKLNVVNGKKEFFRVSLDKIQKKVKELGYDIEFENHAYAPQYRDSISRKA